MATITTKTTKAVTITGTVMAGDAQAKNFNATINTDNPNDISMSSFIINQEAYKVNRTVVNAEITKLEDEAYAEQERMKAAVTSEEEGA